MATVALTTRSFHSDVTDGGIMLVDFRAAWCGPCRRFAPVFEAAGDKHPDIVFAKVDTAAVHYRLRGRGGPVVEAVTAHRAVRPIRPQCRRVTVGVQS